MLVGFGSIEALYLTKTILVDDNKLSIEFRIRPTTKNIYGRSSADFGMFSSEHVTTSPSLGTRTSSSLKVYVNPKFKIEHWKLLLISYIA